jgi:predicted NUDIX family phosphoesterase
MSDEGAIDPMATLRRACDRELAEEIDCATPDRIQVVGVIKESGNAVSRVHIGVVVECWLSSSEVIVRDHGLSEAKFMQVTELSRHAEEMETWSRSLIGYLSS